MKIKLLSLFLFVLLSTQAQELKFGVKAGLNFNAKEGLLETINAASQVETYKASNQTGFHAGVFARVGLGGLFVQPELLYTRFKTEYNANNTNFDLVSSRIDLPVNLGKKFLGIARVQAGPVFSYYLDEGIDLNNISELEQDNFSVGMQLGGGIDLSEKISIDARYEFGFNDLTTRFIQSSTAFNVDERPNLLRISLGYSF